MIEYVIHSTNEYISQMPKALRKNYGQFFTSKETAVFMASLFEIPQQHRVSILDPGAGSGILSVALIERLQSCDHIESIELVCYETDLFVAELLRTNLEWVRDHSKLVIDYEIITENYILSQQEAYNNVNDESRKYDVVIGNPPYMKVGKDAPEAFAVPDVCFGAPNLYFIFATMSLFNLKDDGELVYIIPRSWTSGAYFKKFRQKFLSEGALKHIHLFVNRDKIFDKESVLQETIIIKVGKTTIKPETITITSTRNNADFKNQTTFLAPYDTVVNGEDVYVYLVTSDSEVRTLNVLNKWTNTLPTIGLKMKTGLTVDFRNREALRNVSENNAVPLFFAQHIQSGKISFPIGKESEYIVTNKKGLLQKNSNYLFVKRFTSKEEPRRLQCGVYLSSKHPEYKEISTQNKINFICGLSELSECIVYGLYVLFNSTLYDNYYRILNGSTQVNSTEINSMPVPSMTIIEEMGKKLLNLKDMSQTACDNIMGSYV